MKPITLRVENVPNRAQLIETLRHHYGLDHNIVQLGRGNSIVIYGGINNGTLYTLRVIDKVIKENEKIRKRRI